MTALLAIALAPEAHAQVVMKTVRMCVDITTDYVESYDTDPTTPEAGDWWNHNQPRPARGIYAWITDDTGLQIVWFDLDGCKDVTVTSGNTYSVEVYSEAIVNGVLLFATDGTGETQGSLQTYAWPAVSITDDEWTGTVPAGPVWRDLALAMFAMYRNNMNYGVAPDRACCDDKNHNWYDLDGTCTYEPGEDPNAPAPDLSLPWSSATTLPIYAGGDNCGGSTIASTDEPALIVSCALRWLIAHELGHVIVERRFGGRTKTDHSAPLDECIGDFNGNYEPVPGNHDPVDDTGTPEYEGEDSDPGTTVGKGAFTKEYQSAALREGYASFFSAWLFNARAQPGCQFDWWMIHDLDMDEDLDNDFGDQSGNRPFETAKGDGIVWCNGSPIGQEPDTGDPLQGYAVGDDWLERMVNAADTYDCSGTLAGVSTEFDALRFFWDMTRTTGGDVRPEDLADMYVDMCPKNWRPNGADTSDDVPINRLAISAAHHGLSSELATWGSNGQDH